MSVAKKLNELQGGTCENYILPFFWQHGEDEGKLREYMRAIHQSNIGAVCVESRPHEGFLQDKWWADMDAILDEAAQHDMKVWILDDKHFPTGYAAGALAQAPMELCHQYLDYNTVDICGPVMGTQLQVEKLAHPKPVPPWMPQPPKNARKWNDDRFFRVIAYTVEEGGLLGRHLDLTDAVEDGILNWNVPAGYWRIYVIYLTRDADGRNDYINMLDRDSCRLLLDTVYEPHYRRYGALFGTVIAGFFSDEPPIGNTSGYTRGDLIGKPDMPLPWSAAMPERMELEYGGGWETQLPLLWANAQRDHDKARIRTSYMNAVSKLVEECFSGQLGSWCSDHGVAYIGHMLEDCDSNSNLGPSMGHFYRGLSGQHMAGIDNIGGQVLIGGQHVGRFQSADMDTAGFYHYTIGRMGASAAAIEPGKQGRCLCENFGAYGWQIGVKTEKYLTDHFLARGVNRFVPHAFTPKAFPDPDCPPHFYAHGKNPQYRAFGELMRYTNRVCHLIDGGKPQTPVALLYHGESRWGGAYESNIAACRALTRSQIGFTMIPADVFARPDQYNTVFDIETGIFSVNGIRFSAFVVSGCEYLPKPAADFVVRARAAGFPVVFTGFLPVGVSDAPQEESQALIQSIQDCKTVKANALPEALDPHIARDAYTAEAFADLTVYHYQNAGDVYLLLNESPDTVFTGSVSVQTVGTPVKYDAWSNRVYQIDAESTETGCAFPLTLEPLEMAVILFGDGLEKQTAEVETTAFSSAVPLTDFSVSKATATQYPHFQGKDPANLRQGMSMRYPEFSGFYRFETTAALQPSEKTVLEIEDVYESAELFVNGVSAGIRTAKPYRFDITGMATAGENHIAIEVATTLEREIAAMGIDTACMNIPAPLSPTGIIGSVHILQCPFSSIQ